MKKLLSLAFLLALLIPALGEAAPPVNCSSFCRDFGQTCTSTGGKCGRICDLDPEGNPSCSCGCVYP